jgi:hypothetical protein
VQEIISVLEPPHPRGSQNNVASSNFTQFERRGGGGVNTPTNSLDTWIVSGLPPIILLVSYHQRTYINFVGTDELTRLNSSILY